MGRIVVVGGLDTDIHLFGLRASAGQAPLIADRHLTQPGGKGTNVSRAAARLGVGVALVGRVGDDEPGRDCVAAVAADVSTRAASWSPTVPRPGSSRSSSTAGSTARSCSRRAPTTC